MEKKVITSKDNEIIKHIKKLKEKNIEKNIVNLLLKV